MSYYTSVIILVLLALGVLSVLISENDRTPAKIKRLFYVTNLLIALSATAECAGIHIGQNPNIHAHVLIAFKALDYTLTPLAGGSLIAVMQKTKNKKFYIQWLFVLNGVFQIVAAFKGWMIHVDETNHYTHGEFYPAYIIFYCIILLILVIESISYGKSFRNQNRFSLFAIIFMVFIGIAIQELIGSDLRVAYLALTLGVAYLFIHYSEFSQMKMDEQISEQKVKITIDALTGTQSRFAYVEAMNEYDKNTPENLAVFMIDINGLKEVNDDFGHEAGDELICGAARSIENSIGRNGMTFRIGGDEFVVFARMDADQVNSALEELQTLTGSWSGEKAKHLSVSAGYALASENKDSSVEDLAKIADKMMYEQKRKYYQQNGVDRRRRSAEPKASEI